MKKTSLLVLVLSAFVKQAVAAQLDIDIILVAPKKIVHAPVQPVVTVTQTTTVIFTNTIVLQPAPAAAPTYMWQNSSQPVYAPPPSVVQPVIQPVVIQQPVYPQTTYVAPIVNPFGTYYYQYGYGMERPVNYGYGASFSYGVGGGYGYNTYSYAPSIRVERSGKQNYGYSSGQRSGRR